MLMLPNFLHHFNNSLHQFLLLQATFIDIYKNYFNNSLTVVHGSTKELLLNAILTTGVPVEIATNRTMAAKNLLILEDVEWVNDLRPTNRVLVVTDNDQIKTAQQWLSVLWETSRLAEATVLSINTTIVFNTFFPFDSPNQCGKIINIVHPPLTNLYPNKFKGNLNKCDLRYITEWLMPYVRRAGDQHAGVEDLIFDSIVLNLNGTALEVPLPPGENAQNAQNAKGELIGGMKKAKMQQVDILFSGFPYRPQFYHIVDMLTPHTIDSLVWFVPSRQPLPGFSYLYLAFTWQVWLAVVLVLISSAVAGFLSKSSTLLTDVVAITLNLQVSKNISSLFYIFCFFYSIHITTMYQASLFTLFSTSIFEKPLATIEEAADAHLVSHIFNYHRPLINLSDHALWKKLLARTDYRDRHNPATFASDRNFLLLVQRNPVRYYIESIPIYDEYGPALYQIPLKFLMYPVTFYMSKGNLIQKSVNAIIQKLVEAGFVGKWLKKFDPDFSAKQSGLGSNNVKLSMFHLSGAFGCLILGILVAPFAFIAEIITFRYKNRRKTKSKNTKFRRKRDLIGTR